MSVQIYRLKSGEKLYTKAVTKGGFKSFRHATQNIGFIETSLEHEFKEEGHAPYNVYCTLAEYDSIKKKKKENFIRQTVMGFDIDKIDIARMSEYSGVIARALLVDVEKCFSVCSGSGIHFVVMPENFIFTLEHFDKYEGYYHGWLAEINKALKEAGLKGDCDADFYKAGVMVRWPNTMNIKPVETAPHTFKTKNPVVLLHGKLDPQEWNITDVTPVVIPNSKEVKDQGMRPGQFGSPDVPHIESNCEFLKFAKENPEKLSEPQWFRMLNLLGHMEPTGELAHAYSALDKKRYDKSLTDDKLLSAKNHCGPFTCDSISKAWDGCKSCPHFGKIRSPITLKSPSHIATRGSGFTTIGNKGQVVRHPEDLRRFFEQQHPYIYLRSVGALYLFNGTHFERSSKDFVLEYAQQKYSPICEKNSEREEFYNIVKANNGREPNFFDVPEGFMNFKNGVLNLASMELTPHSPELGFLYCLPYEYDPKAISPTWDLMMQNLTDNKPHMIAAIEEYLGYIVSGMEYHYNKMLVLAGDGNNGKSTILNCMQFVVGEDNYAAVSAKNYTKQFTPAEFHGKLANFSEETGPEALKDSEIIKALTGNNAIQVERKFENPFKFKNRAKLVLTYNKIPYISDQSEGMRRRLLVLPLSVNLDEQKEKLIHDVYTKIKAELAGILNRALAGLGRLNAQKGFTDVPEAREEVNKIFKHSDGVFEMWEDHLTKTGKPEDFIRMDELWNYYTTKIDPRDGGGSGARVERRGFGKKIGALVAKNKKLEVKKKRFGADTDNVVLGVTWTHLDEQQDY